MMTTFNVVALIDFTHVLFYQSMNTLLSQKIFRILIFLIISFLILIGVGYLQPNRFEIETSEIVRAPICNVYTNLADINERQAWSPWLKDNRDVRIETKMSEETGLLESTWFSESNCDRSTFKYLSLVPNKELNTQHVFGNMATCKSNWALSQQQDGTKVIWKMNVTIGSSFYDRLRGIMMKKMLKQAQETGLNNLKLHLIENSSKPCLHPLNK